MTTHEKEIVGGAAIVALFAFLVIGGAFAFVLAFEDLAHKVERVHNELAAHTDKLMTECARMGHYPARPKCLAEVPASECTVTGTEAVYAGGKCRKPVTIWILNK